MAHLACVFLAFVLAYQCADVVNGAVNVKDLPDFVGNKLKFLQHLNTLCTRKYGAGVDRLDLPGCKISCGFRSVFWRFFCSNTNKQRTMQR
uniref:Putative secreted protein n=1 Tax=Ixodes ricinus TaxID=34613 RepID=V5H784_IXORI